jgi:hypothetical protein
MLPEIDFDHDFDFDTDSEYPWFENRSALATMHFGCSKKLPGLLRQNPLHNLKD